MFPNPVRQVFLTLCGVTALALGAIPAPARAADPPPDVPESWRQDPRTPQSPAPAASLRGWSGPGGPAEAGDFTLSAGDLNAETARRVARLDTVLPEQGVQKLLAAADRTATPWCPRDPFGPTALPPDLKYCLQDDDSESLEWIPQAMTGVSDARENERWGSAGDIQLFASYDASDPGRDDDPVPAAGDCTAAELEASDACNQKGVRLTFVQSDTDSATGRPEVAYRHVLLAWAYENEAGHITFDGLHAGEYPLQKGVHAGGMVWYGNHLYLADTRDGLRVFDLRTIMDLDPDGDPATHDAMGTDSDGVRTTADVQDRTKVGRHDDVWYSFGYRYVMPQVAAWKFKAAQSNPKGSYACVSTGAPKASYLSLDRGATPARLVLGEYCRPGTDHPSTGRIASYPVAELARRSGDVTAQGWANFLPLPDGGAQGAAVAAGTLYMNVSNGKDEPAHLYRAGWNSGGELVTRGSFVRTATGAEDLYVDRGAGRLWSLSEYSPKAAGCTSLCQRVLYAHRLSRLDAQP